MNSPPTIVLCNNASRPKGIRGQTLNLNYLRTRHDRPNMRIGLPLFVQGLYHLSPRILDLLEISCYIFAADRLVSRGPADAVEYHSWERDFKFFIRIRDTDFWNTDTVREKLSETLQFMTGDKSISFVFQSGHDTPPADLFDTEEFQICADDLTQISLFSGGLDSLVGAITLLESTNDKICLVSHRSGQPETLKTQNQLFGSLDSEYPGRIKYYKFNSGLTGKRAIGETQRTRAFLFTSIAFALSSAYKQNSFHIFENGITSMNFPRREDQKNARASRTTHPKTISLLEEFYSIVGGRAIEIKTPFFWKTKSEVIGALKNYGKEKLLTSSVSCSRTFQPFERGTHCGMCYQCIDRRFAIYSSNLEDFDNKGLYNTDFIDDALPDSIAKVTLLDYVYQAKCFAQWRENTFYKQMLPELSEIVDYINERNDDEKISKLWDLCKRHGEQVQQAIERMRNKHDDPLKPITKGNFLYIINEREYLKEPIERLLSDISVKLYKAIPIAFRSKKPKNENQLNDIIQSVLSTEKEYFEREYPAISFALCKTIPDHSLEKYKLLIEAKYLRGNNTPAKITNEIGADLFKYPPKSKILFTIFDPERKVYDDVRFVNDIQGRDARATVLMLR